MDDRSSLQEQIIFFARLLLALMFVESYWDKLMHWDFYLAETTAKHVLFPAFALAAAVLVEFLGSLALITGIGLRSAVLALACYTFIVNFYCFNFWDQTGVAATMARKEFLKNLAVVGGLLVFTAINVRRYTLLKK
jgi:putative oxidoreductase